MSQFLTRKQRYIIDQLPIRLGGIAANLARVNSFGKNPKNSKLVASLLRESAWFIEWSAPDTSLEFALELVEIQRQIVRWLADWSRIWNDELEREIVLAKSQNWSESLLIRSGLLEP
ncbi:hypothetical protein [Oscillatoria sp. FACHB-1406]|uniref:hypothetical protein n=1 Tax=Oscillatoria sp. FACHB-1406 TaxID=2692846 RepID=UPI0016897432|nr:hypothetical protein [Oscillatoria sp. FACHB-1406]MBD2576777.1 hypothetical protein [Oscillatoria sp. FACHB-1406]